ncbi:hypothetical protein AB0L42_32330 [Streptomyces sp. NPDC052287]|uniref:hypothetical protein n=1 Tax=Streptomyces sp. NPDC052287 TaxID=3154950 RepID=UPI0034389662
MTGSVSSGRRSRWCGVRVGFRARSYRARSRSAVPAPDLSAVRVRDPYPFFAWLRRHSPARVSGYVAGPTGLNRHLVHADPPDHTRLRTLVNAAFVPRRIAQLEPFIADTANRLLDRIEQHTHVDVIADFAAPLTFRMICAILGVPDELDWRPIRR